MDRCSDGCPYASATAGESSDKEHCQDDVIVATFGIHTEQHPAYYSGYPYVLISRIRYHTCIILAECSFIQKCI